VVQAVKVRVLSWAPTIPNFAELRKLTRSLAAAKSSGH
jgi:hypothetical protein